MAPRAPITVRVGKVFYTQDGTRRAICVAPGVQVAMNLPADRVREGDRVVLVPEGSGYRLVIPEAA